MLACQSAADGHVIIIKYSFCQDFIIYGHNLENSWLNAYSSKNVMSITVQSFHPPHTLERKA